MATPVSRCDPCGCGAQLAVLLNRFEALTATVVELSREVRGWRADQARRRAASEQDDRDAVLGVLVAELNERLLDALSPGVNAPDAEEIEYMRAALGRWQEQMTKLRQRIASLTIEPPRRTQ